jgi:hypothetical protein
LRSPPSSFDRANRLAKQVHISADAHSVCVEGSLRDVRGEGARLVEPWLTGVCQLTPMPAGPHVTVPSPRRTAYLTCRQAGFLTPGAPAGGHPTCSTFPPHLDEAVDFYCFRSGYSGGGRAGIAPASLTYRQTLGTFSNAMVTVKATIKWSFTAREVAPQPSQSEENSEMPLTRRSDYLRYPHTRCTGSR